MLPGRLLGREAGGGGGGLFLSADCCSLNYSYICDATKADSLKEADPAKQRIKNVHIIQKE